MTAALMTFATARDIVANPQPGHSTQLRTLAWLCLKSAREETVLQHRLNGPRGQGGGDAA